MTSEFDTAIAAARTIVQKYKATNNNNLSHPMRVNSARPINSDAPVPADGIIHTVSHEVGLPIQICRIGGELGDVLNGYVLRYTDRAVIGYSSKLNLCWTRLVMCKEASQILLGNDQNYTNTANDAISLITELMNETTLSGSPAYNVENEAYFAATEMLLPQEFTPIVREMKDNGMTNLDIAKSFKVPAKLIAFRYDLDHISAIFEN